MTTDTISNGSSQSVSIRRPISAAVPWLPSFVFASCGAPCFTESTCSLMSLLYCVCDHGFDLVEAHVLTVTDLPSAVFTVAVDPSPKYATHKMINIIRESRPTTPFD